MRRSFRCACSATMDRIYLARPPQSTQSIMKHYFPGKSMFPGTSILVDKKHGTILQPLYESARGAVYASEGCSLGEDAQEERPPQQALLHLRAALRLAQEMGEGLGRGTLLFGSLPRLSWICALLRPADVSDTPGPVESRPHGRAANWKLSSQLP